MKNSVLGERQSEKSHLNLWLLFSCGGFVDGHLNGLFIVGHHYWPQCAVLCVDLFVVYWPESMEHQTLLIPGSRDTNTKWKLQLWIVTWNIFILLVRIFNTKTLLHSQVQLLCPHLYMWMEGLACDKGEVTIRSVFTCPFTPPVPCVYKTMYSVCVYVRSDRSLTNLKLAPSRRPAGFPLCDRWSSNLLLDYKERISKKKHDMAWTLLFFKCCIHYSDLVFLDWEEFLFLFDIQEIRDMLMFIKWEMMKHKIETSGKLFKIRMRHIHPLFI